MGCVHFLSTINWQESADDDIRSRGIPCTHGSDPARDWHCIRVWAPHADAVYVTGSFNNWSPDAHPLAKEEGDVAA
jgi:1,4-alpha-glucan branching enzyme